jgi:hypothetical protein
MKAICLAAAMAVVLLLAVTFVFRQWPAVQRARQMLLVYVASLVVLVAVWSVTPGDLGILPDLLLTEPSWLDLAAMVFFFSAAFFGGALQLYNLADRGFSLRILIDIMETPGAAAGVDRIVMQYGGGSGLAWMYRKRIEGLLGGQFIHLADGYCRLTARGNRLAGFFLFVRTFLRQESSR